MAKKKSSKTERMKPAAEAAAAPPDDRKTIIAICAGLVAIILIVFMQLRNHQFLNFDDTVYVTENARVKAGLTMDGIRWALTSLDFNWHPVTWFTHMLDVELFGVDAGKHLLVNVAYHAVNSILLFLLLRRTTGALWRSAIVAALFAVHPLHVESVAWIAERKDVLMALFFLLTLWFYAGWAERRSRLHYVLALVSLILGLASKGMLVTMPFVLLLFDYWPLRRQQPWRQLVIEKIPFFLAIIPGILVTLRAQEAVGATKSTEAVALGGRLANAVLSYGSYLAKTFWPWPLAIPYPYRLEVSPIQVALVSIVLLAITAAAVMYRERRYLFTGWFWFVGMLVPVIGIIQIGAQAMADRYTYLPLIGFFCALVWLIADFAKRQRAMVGAAAAMAIAICIIVAHRQASRWRDSITLFGHATTVTERNRLAHTSLGTALIAERDFEAAERELRTAIDINPINEVAHAGLGIALRQLGRNEEAVKELREAVRQDPRDAHAWRNLGDLALDAGNNAEAIAHFEKSLSIRDDAATRAALATARGDIDAASRHYEEALRLDPSSAEMRNDYAALLARHGREEQALAQYREALRLNPKQYDANMNLGALLSRMNRLDESIERFTAAATARPQSPEPMIYIALVYAQQRKFAEAAAAAEGAMAIDPQQANAFFTNALRMPPKETNLQEYIAFLRAQR